MVAARDRRYPQQGNHKRCCPQKPLPVSQSVPLERGTGTLKNRSAAVLAPRALRARHCPEGPRLPQNAAKILPLQFFYTLLSPTERFRPLAFLGPVLTRFPFNVAPSRFNFPPLQVPPPSPKTFRRPMRGGDLRCSGACHWPGSPRESQGVTALPPAPILSHLVPVGFPSSMMCWKPVFSSTVRSPFGV